MGAAVAVEEPEVKDEVAGMDGSDNPQVEREYDPEEDDDEETPLSSGEESDEGDEEAEEPKEKEESDNEGDHDAGIDKDLLLKAKELGISEEEAKALKPDTLLKLLGKKEAEGGESTDGEEGKGKAGKPVLNPDEFDEELVTALETQNKRIEELEAQLTRQSSEEAWKRVDSMFDGMVEDLPELFGEGSTLSMDKGKDSFKNRLAVLEEMDALVAGYRSVKRDVPAEKVLFEKAMRSVFGEKMISTERGKIASSVKKRSSAAITKPTQRKSAAGDTPEAKAKGVVARMLSAWGIGSGSDGDDDD